jgi:hypothetical protein
VVTANYSKQGSQMLLDSVDNVARMLGGLPAKTPHRLYDRHVREDPAWLIGAAALQVAEVTAEGVRGTGGMGSDVVTASQTAEPDYVMTRMSVRTQGGAL